MIGNRVFIIAEISANHNGKIENAIELIKKCKEIGADAVKLQTYTPNTITIDCKNEYFKVSGGTLWDGQTLYNLYEKAYMPWDWQPVLMNVAKDIGIECFSTPFDKTSVDFLEDLNVPRYKIASFEITDIPLIRYVASKKKPMIISTGIATLDEINDVVKICNEEGNRDITLLKCTSSYPAPYNEMNLQTIVDMKSRFGCKIGLSDHSLGIEVPIAAVSIGAKVIEKHITLDRKQEGPDGKFSLEPGEFENMIKAIRNIEKAIGKVEYDLTDSKIKNRKFSRSLFIVDDIKQGDVITENNVKSIRPGNGLEPKYYYEVIGKKVTMDLKRGTPLKWEFIKK